MINIDGAKVQFELSATRFLRSIEKQLKSHKQKYLIQYVSMAHQTTYSNHLPYQYDGYGRQARISSIRCDTPNSYRTQITWADIVVMYMVHMIEQEDDALISIPEVRYLWSIDN